MNYSVTIDVPQLDEGLKFYCDALGLVEVARPVATYVILQCGSSQIGLIEKRAGTKPAKGSDDVRRYERHWRPVHIDFHVDDFEGVLAKALNGVATCDVIQGHSFRGDRPELLLRSNACGRLRKQPSHPGETAVPYCRSCST